MATRGANSMRITFPRHDFRLEPIAKRVANEETLDHPQEPGSDFMPIPALHQLVLANYERSVKTRRSA
jgi:hypothetical protein